MSKFNTTVARPATGTGPIVTDTTPSGRTYEGGAGYARDTKSELFLLAVANMVGIPDEIWWNRATFYESGGERDSRYAELVRSVAAADPDWTARFLGWLRRDANMRSASMVGALEAARAMLAAGIPGSRAIIDSVLQRADEPGEALAYWTSRYGRAIPMPVKRGIADAALRLYAEYPVMKYDTGSHGVRFADVLELTHPGDQAGSSQRRRFRGNWQGDLFRHAIGRRHGRDEPTPDTLTMIRANAELRRLAADEPWAMLDPQRLRAAGMTWEDALSLVGSRVSKADLWKSLIPSMGYMALLRNLRNFDEAGVDDTTAAVVAARLCDPDEVARSRQFPFRFLSAYRAVTNVRWSLALERALSASTANIPHLAGRTLILIDQSPSMFPMYEHMYSPAVREQIRRTGITLADQAKLFGVALALRCESPLVIQYGNTSDVVGVPRGSSVLPLLNRFRMIDGTDTYGALRRHYNVHDRVVIVTDEQTRLTVANPVPVDVPVYTWNVAGYKFGHGPGVRNRHTFGGMTDAAFRLIPLMEAGHSQTWPF